MVRLKPYSRPAYSHPAGVVVLLLALLGGCLPIISPYSARGFELATSLKAHTAAVLADAAETYAEHETEVEALRLELEQGLEFARNRPNNLRATQQWELLLGSDDLLGSLLERWQTEGQLGETFVAEAVKVIDLAFDELIELELARKPADDRL